MIRVFVPGSDELPIPYADDFFGRLQVPESCSYSGSGEAQDAEDESSISQLC